MSAPAPLSQRLRDAVDFGPVKYGHAGHVENLLRLVEEVVGLEARAQDNRAIIEAAKDFGSIEWVILESALLELHKNKRVRDGLLNKFFKLRDAVLRPWASLGRRLGDE